MKLLQGMAAAGLSVSMFLAGANVSLASDEVSGSPVVAGVIDGFGGYRWSKGTEEGNADGATYGVAGALAFPLGSGFGLQADFDYEGYKGDEDDDPRYAYAAGGHLYYRDSVSLFGLFGGTAYGHTDSGEDTGNRFVTGGELQAYFDDSTLYLQIGYADVNIDDDDGPHGEGFVRGTFGRIVNRIFIADDTRLQTEFTYGYSKECIDGEDACKVYDWGVELRTRLAESTPLYGFVGYRGAHYDGTTEDDTGTEHAAMVGLSYQFGATSLKDNDRNGASLDLPMMVSRAAPWAEALD